MKSVLFPNSFFSILIFLINWVLQVYLYQILFSIIFWIPLNFYIQKHLQLIDFIYIKKVFVLFLYFFFQKYCTFTFFT